MSQKMSQNFQIPPIPDIKINLDEPPLHTVLRIVIPHLAWISVVLIVVFVLHKNGYINHKQVSKKESHNQTILHGVLSGRQATTL